MNGGESKRNETQERKKKAEKKIRERHAKAARLLRGMRSYGGNAGFFKSYRFKRVAHQSRNSMLLKEENDTYKETNEILRNRIYELEISSPSQIRLDSPGSGQGEARRRLDMKDIGKNTELNSFLFLRGSPYDS